jgi:hypothetical protein
VATPRQRNSRRSSIRARSVFVPRPGPLSDEQEAEEYLEASREKLGIARRHLEALREAEGRLTDEGFAEALLGDEANIRLIEGHGDALLLELSGAFDAFACAVAFRLGRSRPHAASFSDELSQRRRPLGPLVERIKRGFHWKHLTYYRNLAAHKVVVASPAWADESGIHRLRLPDRLPPNPQSSRGEPPHLPLEPAMPIFEGLVEWAERRFDELSAAFAATFP